MGEAGHNATMEDADDDVFPAWARTVEECEKWFGVDWDQGLSSLDATARLRAHGPNELQEQPSPSMLQLVAQQFEDTLVRILLAAAAVSFAQALSSSAEPLILSALEEVGKERNSCKRMCLAGEGDSAAAWRTNRMARAAAGGNDRHSKVVTSRGLWDHYIRIFVPTTIHFYDIKDWLGADQPSKAI